MKSFSLGTYAIAGGVAVALLAGCGALPLSLSKGQDDTQPPIGAAGAMPQTSAIATHADRGTSWMLPEASRGDLLYVSDARDGTVTIYPLGSTKIVGMLTDFALPVGVCSDTSGDVYVADEDAEAILEYAHGGTTRIKTLSDPYASPVACSFDKTTGNLEVTDGYSGVLIYAGASGKPTRYDNYRFGGGYNFAAYDDRGNLLVDGVGESGPQFAELPKGGSELISIKLNATVADPEGVAWDGKYFAICDQGQQPNVIDDVSLSGSSGTLERTVTLDDSQTLLGLAISGSRSEIIAADTYPKRSLRATPAVGTGYVRYWKYPAGGAPIETVTKKIKEPVGVAISKGRA